MGYNRLGFWPFGLELCIRTKWIVLRLHMGSWTYVSNLLNEPPQFEGWSRLYSFRIGKV